jgi:hypothetical protein
MPVFVDADQFYACTRALFARVGEQDPGAGDAVSASYLVIRIGCTGPDAEITINGRKRPLETTFGPARLRPTLDIAMTADALHQVMMGQLSLKSALARKKLKAHGPVHKVTVLADLFHRLQAYYPDILREQGITVD